MTISKAQVEQILKTLPIGYYLNYDVVVKLTDEPSSNHNALTDEIHVSYPQLIEVFDKLNDTDVDNIETFIRTMLYHEVGHALLTPPYCAGDIIMNIFEDERIETLLDTYFMNTSFKQMIKLVGNYDPKSIPTSADEMFFEVVRFRKGPQQFVDRVKLIIKKYADYTKFVHSKNYYYEVYDLYSAIASYYCSHTFNENYKNDIVDMNDISNTIISDDNNSDKTYKNNINDVNKNYIYQTIKQSIKNSLTKFDDANITNQLNSIFTSVKTNETRIGNAIQSRSGVFDARSVIRNDYKWWLQKNRQGNSKAFTKLKLNLFIDCSMSFQHNDDVVNRLLKSLIKLEKIDNDFEFDLIACGTSETLLPKNERIQHSFDGTQISEDIINIYHKVQKRGWKNINICLYDGDFCNDAYSDSQRHDMSKPISIFNNPNSICIFDYDNVDYAKWWLPNAKVIICKNYTNTLIDNVCKALQNLCKI